MYVFDTMFVNDLCSGAHSTQILLLSLVSDGLREIDSLWCTALHHGPPACLPPVLAESLENDVDPGELGGKHLVGRQ